MSKTYRITSEAGLDMGEWTADDPMSALDAMAREAGYQDQEDAQRQVGAFRGVVVEVETGRQYRM